MDTIEVSKIKIKPTFTRTVPNDRKISNVRDYYNKHGTIDKPVVLNGDVLVDNYIRYLIAVENGMSDVPYITANALDGRRREKEVSISFITGVFKEGRKEYVWKNEKGIPISIGDKVLVNARDRFRHKNYGVVMVTNVFQSDDSNMLRRHKPVMRKVG